VSDVMGREWTPLDCPHTWSVDGKRSVAEPRSSRRDLQFVCWRRGSNIGPTATDQAALISQVGRCRLVYRTQELSFLWTRIL